MSGKWRLTRSWDSAVIEVETFPGERPLDPGELADPAAAAVGAVLALSVTDVRVTRLAT